MLSIITTSTLALQTLRFRYNYVMYGENVTTRVLRTSYVYLYVLWPCTMAMLT